MAAVPTPRHAAHFPEGTRGLLVLAHPSQDARATAKLVAAMRDREPLRIHVAAVQCPPTGYAGSFLRGIDVRKLLTDAGHGSMAGLCAELDALGVPYKARVEIGPWLGGIAQLVRELGCTSVMVGANPGGFLRDAALRFDRWLIRGQLRKEGLACNVLRGDEASGPSKPPLGAGAAAHLP